VYRTRSIRVFENPRALPRAFFLPQSAVRRYATEPEEARAVFAPAFDPRRTLVLSGTAAAPEEARSSAEAVVPGEDFTETPGEASFVLDVPSRGFAVVSESAYPGWRAWVDGRPADVLRADYALQAVAVGPGRHRLVLRYRPPVFWTCFAIPLAAAFPSEGNAGVNRIRRATPRAGRPGFSVRAPAVEARTGRRRRPRGRSG
jgi:hypothetical protein